MMRVYALFLAASASIMALVDAVGSCNYQAKESCEAAGCSWNRSPMDDGYGCYGSEIAAAHLGAKKYNFSANGASSAGSCVNQNTVLTFGDLDLIDDEYGLVPTPYNGLSFEELGVTDPIESYGFTPDPLYGYWKLGALAGNNRATYNNFGQPAIIRGYEGCGFAVGSMAILSAWNLNLTATITGGRYNGDPFEMQFILGSPFDEPTIVDLTSWGQMDYLRFESSGGVTDPRVAEMGTQMTTQFFEILGYDNSNLLTTRLKLVDTKKKDHVKWSGMLNATMNQDFRADVGSDGLHMEILSTDGSSTASLEFTPQDCSRRKSTATRFSCKNKDGASIIFKKYNGRVASTSSSGEKFFPSKSSSLYTVDLKWTTRDLDLPDEEDTPLVVTLGVPGGIIYQSNTPDCWAKERASSASLLCYPSWHKLAAKNHN